MDLWLVSPAWGRFAVSRLAFAQRAHLIGELAQRGLEVHCVVVADDGNLDIAESYGFHTLERPNDQLGRKFNDGIEYACQHGADYVSVVGSDDWVHADLFDRLPLDEAPMPELTPRRPFAIWSPVPEVITGREILLVELSTGRATNCVARNRHGVIPWIMPRKVLEPSKFRPVRDQQQKGLDGSLIAGLQIRPEWVFHDPHDLCRVDFKSSTNLNSYELISGAIGEGPEVPDPWSLLAERYPAELVELARETHLLQSEAA